MKSHESYKESDYEAYSNHGYGEPLEFPCEKLKDYYVYALIDPRRINDPNHGIFYVGKGKNNRAQQHANSVGDCKDRTEDDQKESSKVSYIKDIKNAGFDVLECILGRFDTENEAFAVESILIEWVYGREKFGGQLTNIQPGRYYIHIRKKVILERMSD